MSHDRFLILYLIVFSGFSFYSVLLNFPQIKRRPKNAFAIRGGGGIKRKRKQLRASFAWLCYLIPSGKPPYKPGQTNGDKVTLGDMQLFFLRNTKCAYDAYQEFMLAVDAYRRDDLDEAKRLSDSAHRLIWPLFPNYWNDMSARLAPWQKSSQGARQAAIDGLILPPEQEECEERLSEIFFERRNLSSSRVAFRRAQ